MTKYKHFEGQKQKIQQTCKACSTCRKVGVLL